MRIRSVRLFMVIAAAMTVVVAATGVASAAGLVSVGSTIKLTNAAVNGSNNWTGGAGANGEFEVYVKNGGSYSTTGPDFRTFCVEGGNAVEYFSPGSEYKVTGLGLNTQSNPAYANPGSPSLTQAVAALFGQFWYASQNALTLPYAFWNDSTVTYSRNSDTDANKLQEAFWALMGPTELNYTPTNNKFYDAVTTSASAAARKASMVIGADNIGGVQVMNVGSGYFNTAGQWVTNGWNQDQLIINNPGYIPPPVTDVPEPSSLCLFGLAIVGAAWSRRRGAKLVA